MLASVLLAIGALTGGQEPEPAPVGFEARLARHPYFSRLALVEAGGPPPLDFRFQRTAQEDPVRIADLMNALGAILLPVRARFEREVALPLGLDARPERLPFHVIVLASAGDLANYQSSTRARWHLGARSFYDRDVEALVLFEDVFQPARKEGERERSARHAMVHACQQAWTTLNRADLDGWVLEGLADAWARRGSEQGGAWFDADAIPLLVADALDEGRRWACVRTLEELDFVHEPLRLDALYRTRTPEGAPDFDSGPAWWAFYRQASLWVQFLWESEAGARRPLLLGALGRILRGEATGAGLGAAEGAAALQTAFEDWILANHRSQKPGVPVDRAAFARGFQRGPKGAPVFTTLEGEGDPLAAAGEEAGTPAPPALDLTDAGFDERFALALADLSDGQATRAIAALEALRAETDPAEPRARLGRELERARAWVALRDAWAAELARTHGTLELVHAEKKLRAKVRALAAGVFELEPGRGPERVPLEELPALGLAQQIADPGGADAWARLYPYVLAGDPRARKLLKEDGGPASALLADAREDYPARLALASVCRALLALGSEGLPDTPADVRAGLDALKAWIRSAEGLALLERKRPALRTRAEALLRREVELLGPHTVLAGRFEALGADRARLTYEFDEARELDDFELGRYPALTRKALPETGVESEPFAVQGGRLVGFGETSVRSRFTLGAPLTARYTLEFANRGATGNDTLALGLCDDGQEHFLWLFNMITLQMRVPGAAEGAGLPIDAIYLDTTYEITVTHDGAHASYEVEGTASPVIDAAARTQGAVFLFAHCTNQARVERLVLEGRLLPDSFAPLIEARIARELAGF